MKKILLEEIQSISNEVYNFLCLQDPKKVSEGKCFFENGIYINIESYETQNKNERKFESHKKYIDIQYVLEGSEVIAVTSSNELSIFKKYDCENDLILYNTINESNDVSLNQGELLLLMPDDAHMPCLSVDANEATHVKKAVIKIPLSLIKEIKYLVMDVDGTLTDGKIYMGQNGELSKSFCIKDGCGIHDILIPRGIIPMIITGRSSGIVKNRCDELGISQVYQGVDNKLNKLMQITDKLECVAYIGDDINDLECMSAIKNKGGLVGCPADAVDEVKKIADYISTHRGGDGAVRDFIEWLVIKK